MSTLFSAGVLIDMAGLTVGISTPHYLYLNEATLELIINDSEGEAADVIKAIDGNSRAIERCSLPAYRPPRELLLHLSQSNAYHRQLASDVGLATNVFHVYRHLSGVPFHERLTADPRPSLQAMLYNPAEYDPARGIAALWRSVECRCLWSKIPATKNAFENFMDLLQPQMHMLVGGLMVHFALLVQMDKGRLDHGAALDWFHLMEEGFFPTIRDVAGFISPKIHDMWTGSLLAASSLESEPMSTVGGDQIGQLLTVMGGIESALDILGTLLSNRMGKMSVETGRRALELKEQHTTPMIERLKAAASRRGGMAKA
jgi:hypothetical protein